MHHHVPDPPRDLSQNALVGLPSHDCRELVQVRGVHILLVEGLELWSLEQEAGDGARLGMLGTRGGEEDLKWSVIAAPLVQLLLRVAQDAGLVLQLRAHPGRPGHIYPVEP
eukprot:11783553-Heterocapsa_arctica.AAC.1